MGEEDTGEEGGTVDAGCLHTSASSALDESDFRFFLK